MDLKRLKELYEVQFPRPWAVSNHFSDKMNSIVCPLGDAEMGTWMIAEKVEWDRHAEFIVELRNAFPLMVERIRELEEALREVALGSGKYTCFCRDATDPQHAPECLKARKALGIETRPT